MKPRFIPLVVVALALFALLAGYSTQRGGSPAYASATTTATSSDVVDFDGVRDVRLGQTDTELAQQGAMARPQEACGPVLTDVHEASPVFANGELVLMWVNPPLATPEGVGVGTSVEATKAAYPQATTMNAPAGSYQFDGLMVTSGDRAYLFMHDGQTVRKAVVGYTDDVQRLFTLGVGNC
ncbi:hypothetical protein AB0J82_23880 [Asanoa sp. NPDC049518]|uniref:hypothetical protein n=1 Tax=unclassified Asanoa TaxID=2685164 RepID=UPI0034209C73